MACDKRVNRRSSIAEWGTTDAPRKVNGQVRMPLTDRPQKIRLGQQKRLHTMKTLLLPIIAGAALFAVASAASAGTLDDVKSKGFLQCGVNTGLIGFAQPDDQGNWSGLDVDFCRAVAAAIFNDPTKVKFTPLSAKDRFTALQSGEIDVLSR